MNIQKSMIENYLDFITSLVFVDPGDVTEDMSVYDDAIESMESEARYDDNLEYLRFAMDSLIAKPDGRLEQFKGTGYPFTDQELHEILRYAFQTIWPDKFMSEPGNEVPVEFLDISDEEWKLLQES
ncbi:MAG: hypothetical protein AB3N11_10900 [Arenibacterium sp.]